MVLRGGWRLASICPRKRSKRSVGRKSFNEFKDSLKAIDKVLSKENNEIKVQVSKDNVSSKWYDLCQVNFLDDDEIDSECVAHHEYELRFMEYIAKYLYKNIQAESSDENKYQSHMESISIRMK